MAIPVLKAIDYQDLNSRQQENYNFAKGSAILADYGYALNRLSDDWEGADFIAIHIDGSFLKVQLKGRLTVDTKYKGKDIWICFRDEADGPWYLYPHDAFLRWALAELNIGNTEGWTHRKDFERVKGRYSWPDPSRQIVSWLSAYELRKVR